MTETSLIQFLPNHRDDDHGLERTSPPASKKFSLASDAGPAAGLFPNAPESRSLDRAPVIFRARSGPDWPALARTGPFQPGGLDRRDNGFNGVELVAQPLHCLRKDSCGLRMPLRRVARARLLAGAFGFAIGSAGLPIFRRVAQLLTRAAAEKLELSNPSHASATFPAAASWRMNSRAGSFPIRLAVSAAR